MDHKEQRLVTRYMIPPMDISTLKGTLNEPTIHSSPELNIQSIAEVIAYLYEYQFNKNIVTMYSNPTLSYIECTQELNDELFQIKDYQIISSPAFPLSIIANGRSSITIKERKNLEEKLTRELKTLTTRTSN